MKKKRYQIIVDIARTGDKDLLHDFSWSIYFQSACFVHLSKMRVSDTFSFLCNFLPPNNLILKDLNSEF